MKQIEGFFKCSCGAITLIFEDGTDTSMCQETFDAMNIDLSEAEEYPQCFACNHCVNHWGIDLCECGSGEKVGECSCGSHKAMQTFGEKFDSFSIIMSNFQQLRL